VSRSSETFPGERVDNFLKLIVEMWRLRQEKFKGQVVINFDGDGPKDIKRIHHNALEEIEIDEEMLVDLQEIAKKVTGLE